MANDPRCAFCHKPVDTTRKGWCREEIGWAEQRGATGGTHSLMQKKATGFVAHLACVKFGAMDTLDSVAPQA